METQNFKNLVIPSLTVPDIKPHSDYLWVKDKSEEYIKTFAKNSEIHIKHDYARFVSFSWSRCKSRERLLSITLMVSWLFVVEQEIHLMDRENDELEKVSEQIISSLKDPFNIDRDNSNKYVDALLEVWPQIMETATDRQKELYVETVVNYFQVKLYTTVNYKYKHKYVGVDGFREYSRVESCVWIMVLFVEYELEYDLEKEDIPEYVNVKELQLLTIDHLTIVNDIYAVKQQFIRGDIMNYVIAYSYDNQCSLQQAIDSTYEYYTTEIDEKIKQITDKVKSDTELADKSSQFVEFVDGLYDLCYGNVKWINDVNPYEVDDNDVSDDDLNILNEHLKNRNDERLLDDIRNIIGDDVKYYILQ